MNTEIIIVLLYSYLLGSIPFGLIITKIFLNQDIRNIGSGNIGTTNVLRTGNKLLAFISLVLSLSIIFAGTNVYAETTFEKIKRTGKTMNVLFLLVIGNNINFVHI